MGKVLIVKALMGGVLEASIEDMILVGGVSGVVMGGALVGGVSVGEILFNDSWS